VHNEQVLSTPVTLGLRSNLPLPETDRGDQPGVR